MIIAGWFIYRQFNKKNNDLKQFEHFASQISTTHVVIVMGLVVMLMFLNWFLEALKWRYVTKTLINISLWEAVEAVFCGLTWAVTTPNRLGEYGGRVMFLPPRKRIPGIFAMGVGSFSQGSVTNVLGVVAMIWFVVNFIHANLLLAWGVVAIGVVIAAMQLIFYFHINWAVTLLDRVPFIKKYHRFFEVMGRYHTHELINIMGFSIARYITFSMQYFLVFQLLMPHMAVVPMMLMLMLFFVVSSAIPSLDLFDIGVRGFTASHLFVYVTDQNIAVIAGVSSIWLINLFIPAILGSLFVLKLKFF
ncbi:hypothetical protein ACFJIV_28490 [Mucilaginibacter sp. UC70_90]